MQATDIKIESLLALLSILNSGNCFDCHSRGVDDPEDAIYLDFTELPVFGGEEPSDARGIFSWDETSLLIQEETSSGTRFAIVPRSTQLNPNEWGIARCAA